MTKKLALILGVVLSVSCFHANAEQIVPYGRSHDGRLHNGNQDGNQAKHQDSDQNVTPDPDSLGGAQPAKDGDAKVVAAVQNKRRLDFVEGSGMVVTQVLKDDTNGLQHQKWIVRLSNGATMQAIYNLDMCERVALKVGDSIAMGGQFIWTGGGAILHWLHFDPRQNRPDGYVEVNGKVYCGDGPRHK